MMPVGGWPGSSGNRGLLNQEKTPTTETLRQGGNQDPLKLRGTEEVEEKKEEEYKTARRKAEPKI